MNLESIKTFLSDRRAVSPVLGVALLIAITVILAGVIGFVVLGVQAGNADGPSASLVLEETATADQYNIVHKGGDGLKAANVEIRDENGALIQALSADLSTGGSETVSHTGTDIRVVWMDPNSDREVLLAEFNL